MTRRPFVALILGLTLALGACFFVLPSVGPFVFLSPDETANAITSRGLTLDVRGEGEAAGRFSNFPWLHPRSFVAQGDRLLPVGFLGMPIVMGALLSLLGPWILVLATPLLAMSVVFPLTSFVKRWGKLSQIAVTLGWLSFPMVMLYANRGLFANLPVVCLTVWAMWFIWKLRTCRGHVIAGVLTGFALLIRPVEAVWVLPWILFAYWSGEREAPAKSRIASIIAFLVPCLLICLFGAIVARMVYGSWFVIGYQVRDSTLHVVTDDPTLSKLMTPPPVSWTQTWPFGLHPRNVYHNVVTYLVIYLLPWFLLTKVAGLTVLLKRKAWPLLILALYTTAVLSLVYGQALYQDHIRINQVAIANSFLRYLLPISVFAAISLAWLTHWMQERVPKYGRWIAAVLILAVTGFGIWMTFSRDDEGLLATRHELVRYSQIRQQAQSLVPEDAVIVSDRSDKIFFPAWRRVASPLPSKKQLYELIATTNTPLAVYVRTLTPEQDAEWRAAGLQLTPVLPAGNETLYLATRLPL